MLCKDGQLENEKGERDFNPTGRNPIPAHARQSEASLVLIISVVALIAIILAGGMTVSAARADTGQVPASQSEISPKTEERSNRNLIAGGALSLAALVLIGFAAKNRNAPARLNDPQPKERRKNRPFDIG